MTPVTHVPHSSRTPVRALVRLIDDDAEARQSMAFYLELLGWEVVQYDRAPAFLLSDDLRRPGCLVLDVRMPGMSGLDLQQELNRRQVKLPIVFLSGHGDINMAVTALQRGAETFLEKSYQPEDIQAAVKKAMEKSLAMTETNAHAAADAARFNTLSEREKEVARLVTAGLSGKQIAEQLGITERTVKMHRGNVYEKLGLHSTAELVTFLSKADGTAAH